MPQPRTCCWLQLHQHRRAQLTAACCGTPEGSGARLCAAEHACVHVCVQQCTRVCTPVCGSARMPSMELQKAQLHASVQQSICLCTPVCSRVCGSARAYARLCAALHAGLPSMELCAQHGTHAGSGACLCAAACMSVLGQSLHQEHQKMQACRSRCVVRGNAMSCECHECILYA